MKNKNVNKLNKKANGMSLEVRFKSKKTAERFYLETKEEICEKNIPVGGKISYKRKGKKVIFKGNRIIAIDMLADTMDD